MCETECESGWKHSYGVCGGCIIKHNEAIQKTRLVVIAEVNAAKVLAAPGAAEPGGEERGKGRRRAPSACRRGLALPGAGGDRGTSQRTRLQRRWQNRRSPLLQVSPFPAWMLRPVAAFYPHRFLGRQRSAVPEGSGGAPTSTREGGRSPAAGGSSGGAGTDGTATRLPGLSPNELFFSEG